jgi:hypothetical protein
MLSDLKWIRQTTLSPFLSLRICTIVGNEYTDSPLTLKRYAQGAMAICEARRLERKLRNTQNDERKLERHGTTMRKREENRRQEHLLFQENDARLQSFPFENFRLDYLDRLQTAPNLFFRVCMVLEELVSHELLVLLANPLAEVVPEIETRTAI